MVKRHENCFDNLAENKLLESRINTVSQDLLRLKPCYESDL